MPPAVALPLAIVAAYLVGSIDFAVIVGRMHGVDIHKEGSGNPGMSNVLRTMGRVPAAMVFVGDTLKGTIGAAMGMVASGVPDPMVHWAQAQSRRPAAKGLRKMRCRRRRRTWRTRIAVYNARFAPMVRSPPHFSADGPAFTSK